MNKAVQKVIDIALAEVGYLEKDDASSLDGKTTNAGSGNYTKYARDLDAVSFYNGRKQGIAWCDVFIDWLFFTAFGKDKALDMTYQPKASKNNCGAGCKWSMKYYSDKKRLYTSPEIGDQIFFYSSDKSQISHTAYVYKTDSTYVYTVEGNTSGDSGVVANGGGVFTKRYKRTYERIAGYGRPNYDLVNDDSGDDDMTQSDISDIQQDTSIIADDDKVYVAIVCKSGKVNTRKGDSTKYAVVKAFPNGTKLEYVATALNGWRAARYNNAIVWVSPNYSHVDD